MTSTSPLLRNALSVAATVAIAVAFALPMLAVCRGTGNGWTCESTLDRYSETDDSRQFLMMWEVSRISLQEFGEVPSWNPYHCGGVVHYLDPQVPFPGPLFFLLFLWVPAVAGIKIWNLLHLVAGALGARKLVLDRGANLAEQVLASALVLGCGAVAEHLGGGQLWFAPFLLMPWVLWTHERALRDPRWAVLLAALFALAMLEGGIYPVPLMFAALVFDSLGRLFDADQRRGLLRSAAVFATLFPLVAGVKLVPVLRFLAEHPRLTALDDSMNLWEVLQAFTTREHARTFAGHVYVWPEFNAYLGITPVVLGAAAAAAAVLLRGEEGRRLRLGVWTTCALLWCALGSTSRYSLFAALHQLPVFRSLHVPSRFLYPAAVVAAMTIVTFLITVRQATEERSRHPRARRAFVVLEVMIASVVALDLSATNSPRLQQGLAHALPPARASADYRLTANLPYSTVADFPVRGVGTTECYLGFDWPVSKALWTGGAQQRLEPMNAGTVMRIRWSPNSITLRVALAREATLLIDQSFDSGWQATDGTPFSRDGLLAVRLPAGEREVTLRHRTEGFGLGLLLTVLGVVISPLTVLALGRWRAALVPGVPPPVQGEPTGTLRPGV